MPTTPGKLLGGRRADARALARLLAVCCLAAAGCRSLGRDGPVPQSVTMGRQLTQQGASAMERGDWQRAESLLERAVSTSAADVDARRSYADALVHRGAKAEALAQLEEARKLAPEDPSLAVRTGEVYLAVGRTSDARAMVDEALRLDSKYPSAWSLRGRVALASGQPRAALADFQRSLGYAPDDYDVAILIAETYRQLNEPQRALVTLQSLAEGYSPGEEPQQLLYLQGLALLAMGRNDDAARMLAQASHRERPSADLLCSLAEAELLSGRPASAHYSLQQALALDPNHAASRALATRIGPPDAGPIRR